MTAQHTLLTPTHDQLTLRLTQSHQHHVRCFAPQQQLPRQTSVFHITQSAACTLCTTRGSARPTSHSVPVHHSRASLACHRATRSLPPDSIDLSPTSRPHNFAALRVPRPYRGGPVRHLAQGVPVSLTSPLARRAIHAGHVQAKCRRRLRACRCSPRTSMRQRVEVEARKLRVI